MYTMTLSGSTLLPPRVGFKACMDDVGCVLGHVTARSLEDDIPHAESIRVIVQSITLVIGSCALALGASELCLRRRAKKVTAVLNAVRFAVLCLVTNVLWSAFGIVFALGGLQGEAGEGPRWFYLTMVIPLTFIFTLTSVLILSLSWRQVVTNWRRYSSDVDPCALKRRDARIRKVVVAVILSYYIAGAAAMAIGQTIIATSLTIVMYLGTIVMFVVSGKNFRLEVSTIAQGSNLSGGGNRISGYLKLARKASRNATCGLGLVWIMQVLMAAILENVIQTNPFWDSVIWTGTVFFMQLGSILTAVSVVVYARNTRSLGRRVSPPSPVTGLSLAVGTTASFNASFNRSMNTTRPE